MVRVLREILDRLPADAQEPGRLAEGRSGVEQPHRADRHVQGAVGVGDGILSEPDEPWA